MHEIGHNFGLNHIRSPLFPLNSCSIMNKSGSCKVWDQESKEEMMLNKWRKFK